MPNYLATVYNKETYSFDLKVGNGQLVTDSGLGTQILNQLFSSNVTVGPYTNWWGNSFNTVQLGSGLVNLLRGVRSGNSSILAQAKNYTEIALQPFVNAGVVTSFQVPLPQWTNQSGVACIIITILLTLPSSNTPQTLLVGINPASGAYFLTE